MQRVELLEGPLDGLVHEVEFPAPELEFPIFHVWGEPHVGTDLAIYERSSWEGPGRPAVMRYVFQGLRSGRRGS